MSDFTVIAEYVVTGVFILLGVFCTTMSILFAVEYYHTKNKTIYDFIPVCFLSFILFYIGVGVLILVVNKIVTGFKFF